jgi:hypothetical protein
LFRGARHKVPSSTAVPKSLQVSGSGTAVGDWAVIRALSPGASNDPDDGERVAEIAGPATNTLPSDSTKVVGVKIAMKLADVKLSVLGNRNLLSGSRKGPGPRSFKEMTCGGPPLESTVRVAFIRVNAVDTGKSGTSSNSPVKSEMLNVFTPGDSFVG